MIIPVTRKEVVVGIEKFSVMLTNCKTPQDCINMKLYVRVLTRQLINIDMRYVADAVVDLLESKHKGLA